MQAGIVKTSLWSQSGLSFVPSRWQRARAIRWLKRTHAWTGFWGAMLFLMLGISGILLNHRHILEIDTGEPVAVQSMNIAVAPGIITNEAGLGRWAIAKLALPTEPRALKKDAKNTNGKGEARKTFVGSAQPEAVLWTQQFTHPDGRITVEYSPGASSVAVRQDATNILGIVKNLHKGSGVGVAWVLFMDSIAGALITMSVTGFLLWTRLHGGRLIAGGIIISSVGLATAAIWPFLL
jgi:uncharacterized protein